MLSYLEKIVTINNTEVSEIHNRELYVRRAFLNTLANIHLLNFLRYFVITSNFLLSPLFFIEKGFSGIQIGIIASFYGVAPLFISFPAGVISDRFSIKKVMTAAFLILSFIFALLSFASGFAAVTGIFIVIGVANSILETSISSLYYKDEKVLDDNKKYGRYSFWICLGAAAGVITSGVLTFYTDFRSLFIIYSLIMFISANLIKRLYDARFHIVPLSEYKSNILNRKTILFLLMAFILTLHWGAEGTVYSPFLKTFFGLNQLEVSIYISIPLIFLSVAAIIVERITYNKNTNRDLLVLGFLFSGLGHILMVNKNIYISFMMRVLHELGDGLLKAVILIVVANLFAKRSVGGSAGLFLTAMTLGNMVGALIFSTIGYKFGFHYAFIISGVVLLFDMVFSYAIFKVEDY